jgi:hypothetical protein
MYKINMTKICIILFFAVIMIIFGGCTKQNDASQNSTGDDNKEQREYVIVIKEAQNGKEHAYLKIYDIARNSLSAERSETARDELLHLLYNNPKLWIKIFSRVDQSVFRKYLSGGGLAILEYPKGITSEKQWNEEILLKLNNIKGTEKEISLANFIRGYLADKQQ